MKMKLRSVAFATFSVALLGLALLPSLQAQTTAVTDPVGYYTFSAKNGSNMFNPGFVNKTSFAGLVDSTAGSTINVPNGNLTATAFDAGTFATHFVEVTESGDPAEGVLLDIVSNTATAIVVDATPAQLSALALAGKKITVRAHQTLKSIFANAEGVLVGFADGVEIYNDLGVGVGYVWNGSEWRNSGTFALSDDVPIAPGQGLILNVSGDKDLLMVGHVKTTPTRVTAYANILNLGGQVNPLFGSSNTLGSLGIEGEFVPFADGIEVFSTDAGGNLVKDGSYILDGGGTWRDGGTFADATNAPIDFTKAISITGSNDKSILLPRGW